MPQNVAPFQHGRVALTDPVSLERGAALRACQERLLMRSEDVAILRDFEISELLDDCEGLVVPRTRVRQHMARLIIDRPDLVARVEGRWAWVVRLAGFPDVAS